LPAALHLVTAHLRIGSRDRCSFVTKRNRDSAPVPPDERLGAAAVAHCQPADAGRDLTVTWRLQL